MRPAEICNRSWICTNSAALGDCRTQIYRHHRAHSGRWRRRRRQRWLDKITRADFTQVRETPLATWIIYSILTSVTNLRVARILLSLSSRSQIPLSYMIDVITLSSSRLSSSRILLCANFWAFKLTFKVYELVSVVRRIKAALCLKASFVNVVSCVGSSLCCWPSGVTVAFVVNGEVPQADLESWNVLFNNRFNWARPASVQFVVKFLAAIPSSGWFNKNCVEHKKMQKC